MSSTTNPPETEVQKVKLDAEALLKHIEDFFEHLIHHTPAEQHHAIKAAMATTAFAALPPNHVVVTTSANPMNPTMPAIGQFGVVLTPNPIPVAPVAAAAPTPEPTTSSIAAPAADTTAGETGAA